MDHELLERLLDRSVFPIVEDDFGARDAELHPLAADLLDQDRQVQFPAPGDLDPVRSPNVLDTERHVDPLLARQPVPDLAQGDCLALGPRERTAVHEEEHRDRRLLDLERRQDLVRRVGRRDRITHSQLLESRDPDDVAGRDLLDLFALDAPGHPEPARRRGIAPGDLPVARLAVDPARRAADELLPAAMDTLEHAAAADPAQVVAPGERRDLHPERGVDHGVRRRHALDDRLEERRHPLVRVLLQVADEPPRQPGAVEDREVRLLVGRAQLEEQVEGVVERLIGIGVRPVDLVEEHDRPEAALQRPHEHVPRLRHRTLVGVHQEERPVDHRQHPLDLPAEVRVPRSVDDVDPVPLPLDRAVLGADRDAPLALEIARVHDALGHLGPVPEDVRRLEDRVDERGLPVVDMGDDRQVPDTIGRRHVSRAAFMGKKKRPGRGRGGLSAKGIYTPGVVLSPRFPPTSSTPRTRPPGSWCPLSAGRPRRACRASEPTRWRGCFRRAFGPGCDARPAPRRRIRSRPLPLRLHSRTPSALVRARTRTWPL